jgi:hypothetical protein
MSHLLGQIRYKKIQVTGIAIQKTKVVKLYPHILIAAPMIQAERICLVEFFIIYG